MSAGCARSCGLALVLGSLAACLPPRAAAPPDAAPEDALRFRTANVDASLPDVDAIGYAIDLRVDDTPGQETFAADVKGSYVATRDLTELALDFEGNAIDGVLVGGRSAAFRREGARLVITLPSPVASGRAFTSRVRYHGAVVQADGAKVNDFAAFGGLNVRQRNAEGKRIYSSINWPNKARRWLPLRDHPSDGAMLAMSLTFPRSFLVLANGALRARTENDDGSSTWRYESLTPMPTYDIHLAAYEDWKVHVARAASGVPIVTYTYPSHAGAQAAIYGDLPKALDFYERAFGRYRWGTASFLEEPIFGGAMEHASVVSMDEALFRTPTEARTAAFHELAHHFCGNLVRVRTWNDFWLSEGFAEYLTARFVAENDGPAAKARVYRGYLTQALAADRRAPHPVRPADPEIDVLTIFDAISYQKGALVLRALGRVVGEARLTDFVRGWFERHTFGAVTTRDLERELTAGTGADLRAFFEGFVYGSYHPEVRVSFRAVADGETELEVEQVQASGPRDGFAFPLDVDLIDDAGRAERFTLDVTRRRTTRRVRAARPPRSLLVDPEEYLLGTVVCAAAESPCKEGFRCAEAGGAASPGGAVSPRVCVPR